MPLWFISWQGPRWRYFLANRWPVYYSIGLEESTVILKKNGIIKTFFKAIENQHLVHKRITVQLAHISFISVGEKQHEPQIQNGASSYSKTQPHCSKQTWRRLTFTPLAHVASALPVFSLKETANHQVLASDSACTSALMEQFVACKMPYITNVVLHIQKSLCTMQTYYMTQKGW